MGRPVRREQRLRLRQRNQGQSKRERYESRPIRMITSPGWDPSSMLVQGSDGSFYGATAGGNCGGGTLFRISPSGNFASLYSFCPLTIPAGLVQGSDGNFYGTTVYGGGGPCNSGCGSVFELNRFHQQVRSQHERQGRETRHGIQQCVAACDDVQDTQIAFPTRVRRHCVRASRTPDGRPH